MINMDHKRLENLVISNYSTGYKSRQDIHDYLGALDVIRLINKKGEYYSQNLQKELYLNCVQQKEGLMRALTGTNIRIENVPSHTETICKYKIIYTDQQIL